uniref:Uncharacterized protein n=1 Tax=Arundo donax TaxID=35708 RepID=A0A0A9BKJ2_ARUDO
MYHYHAIKIKTGKKDTGLRVCVYGQKEGKRAHVGRRKGKGHMSAEVDLRVCVYGQWGISICVKISSC